MCGVCWQGYGEPREVTPRVRPAVEAIKALYAEHGTGGALHIVVDDWNLEDEHLAWCGNPAAHDDPGPPLDDVERHCFALLSGMTVAERATALAIQEGCLP